MTERERLIAIMQEWGNKNTDSFPFESVADHLLANGVIVPPCKAGDTLFLIVGDEIIEDKCTGFWIGEKWLQIQLLAGRTFTCWDGEKAYFGKTVFLSRKEAEAALERSRG